MPRFSGETFCSVYRTLRVDHLLSGELDYELLLRNIAIADDESRCKRRRRLREILKQEREGHEIILEFDHDPETDYNYCLMKFQEIKQILMNKENNSSHCRARLLHLGHRLAVIKNHCSGKLAAKCNETYQEVISLFSEYFWNENSFFADDDSCASSGNESPPGAAALRPPPTTSYTGTKPKRMKSKYVTKQDFTSAMKEVADLFKGLTTEFRELKTELQTRKSVSISDFDLSDILIDPIATAGNTRRDEQSVLAVDANTFSRSSTHVTTAISQSIPFPPPTAVPPSEALASAQSAIPKSSESSHNFLNSTNPFLSELTLGFGQTVGPTRSEPMVTFAAPPTASREPAQCLEPRYGSSRVNSTCVNDRNHAEVIQYPRWSEPEAPPPPEPLRPQNTTYNGSCVPALGDHSTFPMPSAYCNFSQGDRRPQAYHSRKVIPVSQWKIHKYKADDQGLGMNEFLENVMQLALSEHVSDEDLFDSAIHLFDGPALSWYTAMRSHGRLRDWNHLVQELKKAFRHPDLDAVLRVKIYQYRQQRHETFQQYYLHMEKLFRSMSVPMSETDKLEVLKMNLRFDYRKLLVGRKITSLQSLVNLGHDLDAADSSAFARVFGNPKKEACALSSSEKGSPQTTRVFTNKQTQPGKPNPFPKHDKNPKANSTPKSKKVDSNSIQHDQVKVTGDQLASKRRPTDSFSKIVNNYRPPPHGECFNCRDDHNTGECPFPRRLFCQICAFPGVEYKNCPFCSKNPPRES